MVNYIEYLVDVQKVAFKHLKFLDEAHIVSKHLTNSKVLGLLNQRTWVSQKTIHQANATVTIITSVTAKYPLFVDYTEEINTQWSFTDFIARACVSGFLVAGDILICDNAKIHSAQDSWEFIDLILSHFGVRLIYLPAYSPELNPCELVFAQLKHHIRNYRDGYTDILVETIKGLSKITVSNIVSMYCHCIFPPVVLPEIQRME